MSRYAPEDAARLALWETLDQRIADAAERLDRLFVGDEVYDHSLAVSAEVRRIEHEMELERYREAVRISEANRKKRGQP